MTLPRVAYADEIQLPPSYIMDYEASIKFWAAKYNVSAYEMEATQKCESGFVPNMVGDHGTSFGVSQIHLVAHKDITKAQALDADWATKWMAEQFSIGNKHIWTCARLLGFSDG